MLSFRAFLLILWAKTIIPMLQHSRRSFIRFLGKAAALSGLMTVSGCASAAAMATEKKGFVHHVYFWLKNPESKEDQSRLIAGLKELTKVKSIQEYHIGLPAATNREVIDSSYAVSWLLFFEDKAAQDSYQEDPIHLKFIEEYAALWSKVVVYDSEAVG